jgi:hypothetical protein
MDSGYASSDCTNVRPEEGAAMHLSTAKAVPGLKPESSVGEAQEILEAQANRLHPDRVQNSLRPATESTMAAPGCPRTSPDAPASSSGRM